MSLLRSVATVGGFTMASRVLGFIRDILIATVLGAGPVSDAFFVAFRIPNMFRRLVAEGAFSAAFVPLFARQLEEGDEKTALEFASHALAFLTGFLFLFSVLFMIFMPFLMQYLAPGFEVGGDRYELAVTYTRITFPYLTAMAVVALLGGVLNAFYKFAAMSAAPILLNIILISALSVQLYQPFTEAGLMLSIGVAFAGLGQVIYLVVACKREGVMPPLLIPRLTDKIKRLFKLMLPGLLGAGVLQINILVGTIIASLLATGSISYLYYADRVYQLPLGVIGIAVGTALLPMLTRQIRSGNEGPANDTLNRAVELSMLFTIPAAAALMAIATPIVQVLFEHGAFDEQATKTTAEALIAFSSGLPAYVLTKVYAPGFFAREDTTTPVIIGVIAMVINIALSLLLLDLLAHVGIALATSIAAWVNAVVLFSLLIFKGQHRPDRRLLKRIAGMVLAAAAMTALLLYLNAVLQPLLSADLLSSRILGLAMLIAAGGGIYGITAVIFGAARLSDLKSMLRRRTPNKDHE
ncbi:murein biosynthesis integral membrane protein MurJ [Sneathiella sp. P13V-1]|uniref:murein biosynthesis integral membrane protein MurJ n=1 Tax=Sneathiella sp. P13V-1 TaxID=2697366 RepID=UPI00187B3FD2|nr:murein biosynthesis integral membrane protein MurJ [Sneathiella sp. P13V-1]MBE7635840.1 murein biosynthesis integral membrane protein MurJ [Sneathiella sp. P13V-1]